MLSLAQVSSMNTSRSACSSACCSRQRTRASATLGRSCWAARRVFFEGQLLALAEAPHRPIADCQAMLSQLLAKFLQRQVRGGRDPRQKPFPIRAHNPEAALAPHRLGRYAAGLAMLLHPPDHAAHPDPEYLGRLVAAPPFFHRGHHPPLKVIRIWFHPGWPPSP